MLPISEILALLEQARAGDVAAYGRLYAAVQDPLAIAIRSKLGPDSTEEAGILASQFWQEHKPSILRSPAAGGYVAEKGLFWRWVANQCADGKTLLATDEAAPQPGVSSPASQPLDGLVPLEHLDLAEFRSGAFMTTHWSLVFKAGQADPAASAVALEQLCRTYWQPIYAFIRRQRGATHEEAEDLTQGFFEHLFERQTLKKAAEGKGKFRTFLLSVLEKFMANKSDRNRAWKRGGRHTIISLDEAMAKECFAHEPADLLTPEKLFARNWVVALLNKVLARLDMEYTENGQRELFKKLEPAIAQVDEEGFYKRCALALGKTETSLKVAMHRLRKRYRELLLSEVAQTVSSPEEIEDELRFLFASLSG
jgi:RNA polymerase sigma-70 factor (ECF subfamily)